MAEAIKAGGRRQGQGRKTEYQEEGKGRRQSTLKLQQMLEAVPEETWAAILGRLADAASAGDMGAIKLLLEHTKGRAATQAPVETDTTINVIAVDIPRPGGKQWRALYDSLCPKCKPKLMVKRRGEE